ncbi:MAG: hypothetical protein R6V25_10545 [Desulfatiglandales bacterium]
MVFFANLCVNLRDWKLRRPLVRNLKPMSIGAKNERPVWFLRDRFRFRLC